MRTTINISDGILAELRERAQQRRRPFREIVEETLQRGLGTEKAAPERVRIQTRPIGVKPAFRGMSMNQFFDELETEDFEARESKA